MAVQAAHGGLQAEGLALRPDVGDGLRKHPPRGLGIVAVDRVPTNPESRRAPRDDGVAVHLFAGSRDPEAVVGDDDQAIYAFRGCSHEYILNLDRHLKLPVAKYIILL